MALRVLESWADAFDGAAWTGQAWRLYQSGEVLLAGPFAADDGAFALFGSHDARVVQALVDQDPAVGRLFTATLQPRIPAVGQHHTALLCTIWTAVASDAVLTRRTNDPTQGGYPPENELLVTTIRPRCRQIP